MIPFKFIFWFYLAIVSYIALTLLTHSVLVKKGYDNDKTIGLWTALMLLLPGIALIVAICISNKEKSICLTNKTSNIMKYCSKCGAEIHDEAVICPKCGCPVTPAANVADNSISEKNWLTTFLLCFFLGAIGIHRFYVGRVGSGIAMILTLGGLGIWVLIDFIVILCGNFKDKEGKVIKNK